MSQKRNSRESVIQQSIEGTCTGITDIVSLSSNEKFRKTVMMILKVKDTVEMKTKLHANVIAIAKQKYGGHSDLWQIANSKIRKTSSFETTSSNGTKSVDKKDEDWSKIGLMLDSDNTRMMASEMVRVNEQASSQHSVSQGHEGMVEKNCKTSEKKDDDWSKIGLMLDSDSTRMTATEMIPVHEQASSQQRVSQSHKSLVEKNFKTSEKKDDNWSKIGSMLDSDSTRMTATEMIPVHKQSLKHMASQSHESLIERNSKTSEKTDDDWSNIGALLDSKDMVFKENQKDQTSVLSRASQKDTQMLETFAKNKDMDHWPVDSNTTTVTDTRNRIQQASSGTFCSVSQNYQYATEMFPKSSKVHLQQKKKIQATSLSADARGTSETMEKIQAAASLSDEMRGTSGKDKRVDMKVAKEKDVLKTPDLSQIIEGVKNVSPFSQLAFESPPLNHEICHRDSLNFPQQESNPRNQNGYNSQHLLSFSNLTQFPVSGKDKNGTLSANDQIVPSMELNKTMKSMNYPYFDKLPKMDTNNISTYNENSEKPSVSNCFDSLSESPILSKERQNDSNCFDSLNESPIISRDSQIQLLTERLARKEEYTSYDGDNIDGPKTASKGRHLAKPEATEDVVIANNTDEWFDNVLLEVEDWLN